MRTRDPCISYLNDVVLDKVRLLQKELFELTGAKSSFVDWEPHIAVGNALLLDDDEYKELCLELNEFVKSCNSFEVKLKGFGFKDNWKGTKIFNAEPYACNLGIVVNDKLLELVKEIDLIQKKYDYKYDIFPYKPHVTLAFRDLNKEGYEKAKKYLKDKTFSEKIVINSFSLATDINKKEKYEEVRKFEF